MPIKRQNPKPTGFRGIRKDGDRYLVSAWWRCPKTGKEKARRGVAYSLKGAVQMQADLRGAPPKRAPTREKWRSFAKRWATEHAEAVQRSTKERYISALAHINTAFGDHYVDAIDVADIRRWTTQARKDFAASTVGGWIRVLRVAMEAAVEQGLRPDNPARQVKAPKAGRTKGARGVALSPPQFARFIGAVRQLAKEGKIAEDLARMILVLAWTGCRMGELLALSFGDVRDGEIFIERAAYRGQLKSTKNGDARIVALVEPLEQVLQEQRAWLLKEQHDGLPSGLVFPAPPPQAKAGARRRGDKDVSWVRSASCLNKAIKLAVKTSGVPDISPHSLRRTFEKLLRKAQVDPLVRRSSAGWRSPDAQDIYSDVDVEDRRAAGEAVVKLVSSSAKREKQDEQDVSRRSQDGAQDETALRSANNRMNRINGDL